MLEVIVNNQVSITEMKSIHERKTLFLKKFITLNVWENYRENYQRCMYFTRKFLHLTSDFRRFPEGCRNARLNGPLDDYTTLRKQRRKSLRTDRFKWLEEVANRAEINFRKNNSRDLFKDIREICEHQSRPSESLRLSEGELITDVSCNLQVRN